ncbi:GNAT family N-acetyltransferase [Defluviimonas sp. WL0002]|uniref:GNAT family N-acetyltransferase n=1 Tax=Albidovulum marisflavi TaxID=2984159 RepID=A0ABT2ZEJ6_9RHOB|nr:GNAT family protein [Defluviimonas sp. WL0002]MCV2869565.1 GNAT family N-acetyltransferase [Defluviimonas sp. WL0002]
MTQARDIGERIEGWRPPVWPGPMAIEGRYARLERLSVDHAQELDAAARADDRVWDYMPYGPFATEAAYADWVAVMAAKADPWFYAVRNLDTGRAEGVASWLRITPEAGSIEVGHILFSPALQRTRAATEAMFLMMGWVFGAGYRRYEWKCNAQNLASRRAAERFGFTYEGVFRQAAVIKGRNRDTAWFAAIDREWPALRAAYEAWLDPANFDAAQRQKRSLAELTAPILVTRDLMARAL